MTHGWLFRVFRGSFSPTKILMALGGLQWFPWLKCGWRTLVQGKQIQCQMRRDHWAAAGWVLSPQLNSTACLLPLASGLQAPVTTHQNQSPQTTTSFLEGEWSWKLLVWWLHLVVLPPHFRGYGGKKGEVQTLSFPGFRVQLGSFSSRLISLPFHVWCSEAVVGIKQKSTTLNFYFCV